MYFMLGDEADAEQSRGQKLFVYGAIFVPHESTKALTDGVDAALQMREGVQTSVSISSPLAGTLTNGWLRFCPRV